MGVKIIIFIISRDFLRKLRNELRTNVKGNRLLTTVEIFRRGDRRNVSAIDSGSRAGVIRCMGGSGSRDGMKM